MQMEEAIKQPKSDEKVKVLIGTLLVFLFCYFSVQKFIYKQMIGCTMTNGSGVQEFDPAISFGE